MDGWIDGWMSGWIVLYIWFADFNLYTYIIGILKFNNILNISFSF